MKSKYALALGAGAACSIAQAAPSIACHAPLRRRLFPGLSGIGDRANVALTFDDGPDPRSTPQFLEALDTLGFHATFFMLGSMVKAAPHLAADVAAAGHEIAVHGYRHRTHLLQSPRSVHDDLRRGADTIADTTGADLYWHRPPFGTVSAGTLLGCRQLGLRLVLWTSWGRDWRASATAGSVVADLTRVPLGGATLLLHDSDCTSAVHCWRAALGALEPLAEQIADRGLTAGTLSEHGL